MYTFEPPILYPEASSAESLLRSASKLITRFAGDLTPDAVRSFFGGFSSTSGYVPGNEALVFRRERRSTFQDDHFLSGVVGFYPVNSGLPCDGP